MYKMTQVCFLLSGVTFYCSDADVKSEPGDFEYKLGEGEASSPDNDDIPLKKRKYTKRDTATKS